LVSGKPPSPISALPPVSSPQQASPKAISGRTSYLQVRLAFHRYPQLIRTFCNRCRFGPPRALTHASTWPWVDHLVSRLPPATYTRPLQTRFRSGSGYHSLNLATDGNSPVRSTKSTPSPGGPKPSPGSDIMSAHGFRISFTPLDGVLFTIPSRYLSAIGHLGYLALEGGPPCFQRDFACPAVLTVSNPSHSIFTYGTLTLSGRPFQQRSVNGLVSDSVSPLPRTPLARSTPTTQRRQAHTRCWFRLLPFRSPLLREYSLFLRVLRCFSSPGSPDMPMDSACRDGVSPPPGCPIRIPLDPRLPAAPQGVSSRGHVLLRPQTPRHPPCAFSAILRLLNTHGGGFLPSPDPAHPHTPILTAYTVNTGHDDQLTIPELRNETFVRQMSFSLPHLLRCCPVSKTKQS
jgi:hypothetical protein